MATRDLVAKVVIGGDSSGAVAALRDLIGRFSGGLVGAVAAAGAALAAFTVTQTAAIAADQRRARSLGLTTTALRDLRAGAADAKVESATLDTAIDSLSRHIVGAAGGARESVRLFRAIGVSFADSAGKARPLMDVLGEVANRLATYRDGIEKTQLVKQLFGTADTRFIDFLDRGSEGMSKFSGMTEELSANAVKLQGEIDRLNVSFERFKNAVLADVLPPLNEMIDRFGQAQKAGAGWFNAFGIAISEKLGAPLREQEKALVQTIETISSLLAGTNIGGALLDAKINQLQAVRKMIAAEDAVTTGVGEDREFALRGRRKPAAPVVDRTRQGRQAAERDDFLPLKTEIAERISVLGAEATATGQLSEAQKFALAVLTDIREGRRKLTDEQKRSIAVQLEQLLVTDREVAAQRQQAEFEAAAAENRQSILVAAQRELDADRQALKQKGLLASEILALEEARLRDVLAQQTAAGESEQELQLTRQLIALARERRTLFADEESLQRRFETGWFDAFRSFADYADNSALEAARLFGTFVRDTEDAFAEFAINGRLSFKNMLRGIADDLARFGADKLLAGLFGALAGGAGGSGFLDFVGNAFISMFGLHSGGIAGRDGFRRNVSSWTFALAPRFHTGGIAGLRDGEVPAILQAGEEVITRDDPRHAANAGGAGGISINVAVNGTDASAGDQRAAGSDLARLIEGVVSSWAVRQQRPGGILYGGVR